MDVECQMNMAAAASSYPLVTQLFDCGILWDVPFHSPCLRPWTKSELCTSAAPPPLYCRDSTS